MELAAWFVVGCLVLIMGLLIVLVVVRQILQAVLESSALVCRLANQQRWTTHQLEAIVSLYSTLPIERPLPSLGGWSVSPDFAKIVVQTIDELRPEVVVELGSGGSTVIIGYALRQHGCGKLVSFEHDAGFAEHTRQLVSRHGLGDCVEVVHAALEPWQMGSAWYRESAFRCLERIDLLIVDGPPNIRQNGARYQAGPSLFPRLALGAVVLVDDANRSDEKDTVEKWLKEYPMFEVERLQSEKGAVLLRCHAEGVTPRYPCAGRPKRR